MSEHKSARPARVVTVTVSDTRTEVDDRGGAVLRETLAAQGHRIVRHAIVRDDIEAIRAVIHAVIEADEADAVVLTGGTGIAPRDVTYEAVEPMLDKSLPGFGEAFRRISWEEVGPRGILSRAVAGTRGRTVIAALPGSPRGVRTAVEGILGATLGHMVSLLRDGAP